MMCSSPTARVAGELRRSRYRPAGARSREKRQHVRARSVAVPRAHIGGDTDALDWRSDPHLLAILARCAEREQKPAGWTRSP
jgi:hypothetical protein